MATVDWEVLVVIACTFVSFLFSASETALTSLGRLEVQSILTRGGRDARLIRRWIRDERRYLTTVLVGNNVANILGSSLLTFWATREHGDDLSAIIGTFTVVIIMFAEILPKLWANEWSSRIAPYAMVYLSGVDMCLRPVTYLIQKITSRLVMTSGMPGRELHQPISEAELEETILIATKGGGIDRETGAALANVIDFSDRLARDVMIPRDRIQAVSVASGQDELLRFVSHDGHSRYPIYRGSLDNVVGLLLVKDLMGHLARTTPGSWTRVVRRPYFISELTPLGTVLRDMKRQGAHLALVRNETGVVTGLLTLEDVIEEIIGDIRDETDDPSAAGGDGVLGGPRIVNGEIPIVDFNGRYRARLPMDGGFSTLNGYLLARTGGTLPPVGTMVFGDDVTFRIHGVSDRGIASVEVIDHSGTSQD